MSFNKTPLALALAALLALGGCAGGDDADVSEDTEEVALEDSGDGYADDGETMNEDGEEAPALLLTADNLDDLELGLVKENEGLQAALDKLAEADTDAGKLMALGEIDMEAIDAEAADAADVSADEYAMLKDQLFEVLGAIEMRQMMEKQFGDADMSGMDEATRAEAEKNMAEMMAGVPDPFDGMDPALAEALRAKQARLAELRAQNIGLLFKFIGG